MKKYTLFAGVNGSGKSTLYNTQCKDTYVNRVNTDEIIASIGDWKNSNDVMRAGKIAIKQINGYLESGISFNQETTLCGNSIIKNINKAKHLGYFIEMHYIGLNNPDIAIERIANRVKNGGHGIDDDLVIERYYKSFINLKRIFNLCNRIALYDNSQNLVRFAQVSDGKVYCSNYDIIPDWFYQFMSSDKGIEQIKSLDNLYDNEV